jgi:CelD/BcsL family acetyltransferase involved in cellulose biosynthesis
LPFFGRFFPAIADPSLCISVTDMDAVSAFEPSVGASAPPLLVVSRYRVQSDRSEWLDRMRSALTVLGESDGFVRGSISQATDDADLLVVSSTWTGVGAYRRALSRFEVKMHVIPLLSTAIDEPSAFEALVSRDESGESLFASGLAADHDSIGLGSASAAFVAPVGSVTNGDPGSAE